MEFDKIDSRRNQLIPKGKKAHDPALSIKICSVQTKEKEPANKSEKDSLMKL